MYYLSTWIRVGKHLLISFNFTCLDFLLCCLLKFYLFIYLFILGGVVLWSRICVEVAVDRISIQPPYFPVRFFVSSPLSYSLFNTSDSYLKSVHLKLVPLKLVVGHLERSFPESIISSSEMGQNYYGSHSLYCSTSLLCKP